MEIFDYDYQRGTRNATTHRFSVGAAVLAERQPHLMVDHRTEIGHPLADVASSIDGIRGIDAKVRVWCEERAFAEHVLTGDVLAALNQLDCFGVEIGDQVIVWARRLPPERQASLVHVVTLICTALDARPNEARRPGEGAD